MQTATCCRKYNQKRSESHEVIVAQETRNWPRIENNIIAAARRGWTGPVRLLLRLSTAQIRARCRSACLREDPKPLPSGRSDPASLPEKQIASSSGVARRRNRSVHQPFALTPKSVSSVHTFARTLSDNSSGSGPTICFPWKPVLLTCAFLEEFLTAGIGFDGIVSSSSGFLWLNPYP